MGSRRGAGGSGGGGMTGPAEVPLVGLVGWYPPLIGIPPQPNLTDGTNRRAGTAQRAPSEHGHRGPELPSMSAGAGAVSDGTPARLYGPRRVVLVRFPTKAGCTSHPGLSRALLHDLPPTEFAAFRPQGKGLSGPQLGSSALGAGCLPLTEN